MSAQDFPYGYPHAYGTSAETAPAPETFLVVQGIYSDKRVLCAAPDRATADAIAARINRIENSHNEASVETAPLYADAEGIPCVITHPYDDEYTEASWPWSYDWDDPRTQKIAADAAAKLAAEEAGL